MTNGVFRLNRRHFTFGAAAALTACGRRPAVQKDADVIIIGAGLSGLNAAMWLQEDGYRIKVLEASDRIGGRLLSLRDLPGQPEAGGSEVGQSYARILHRAAETGVEIAYGDRERDQSVISIGGENFSGESWATAAINPFPTPYKTASPGAALFAAMGRNNPFYDSGAWRDVDQATDISAADFLRGKGFDSASLALINMSLNANDLETYSMANLWRSMQLFMQDSSAGPGGRVKGGSQALPEAMAASLGDAVQTGVAVEKIEHTDTGVTVCSEMKCFTADFCILALPFPAVQKIMIDPAPAGAQAAAIKNLPYTQILQLHLEPETPFWEEDGLPPSMWTDSKLERLFAIKDHENQNTVGFISWINGDVTQPLSALPDEELEAMAQQELKQVRPASDGRVKLNKAVRWTKDASYVGGAYMHWAPGQIGNWAKIMGAPLGRIHFAGEHLSYLHTGMEGAMEAGQNTAMAIMETAAG